MGATHEHMRKWRDLSGQRNPRTEQECLNMSGAVADHSAVMPAKIASHPEPVMQLVGSREFVTVEIRVSGCEDGRRRRTTEDHFARKRPFGGEGRAEIRISREDFSLVLSGLGDRHGSVSNPRQYCAISQSHGITFRARWP